MITKEELERIKQGDGLTVESNGIRHYGASEVLINGHSLTEVLEAAAAYKEEQPKVLDADDEKPETLQDVIADMDKYYIEYWGCSDYDCEKCPAKINGKTPYDYYDTDGNCIFAMYEDIQCRLKAIAERMGGDGENKADEPVENPKKKTCPHCGSSHVITTKVITIGEGKRSETETDFCLRCGRDLVGEQ